MSTILIVEDEATVLMLAESVLAEIGHETFTASSLEQARAVIEGDGRIDLVFTDLGLGENLLAGRVVIDMARARDPDVKALVTTGQVMTDGLQTLLDDDVAILPKPYTVPKLERAIRDLLEA